MIGKRLRLNAFSMNCVSHIQHGLWRRADSRQLEFNRLEPWIDLARLLEKGGFDSLFLADVIGMYDIYRGGAETAAAEAAQELVQGMKDGAIWIVFRSRPIILDVGPFGFGIDDRNVEP